MMSAYVHFPPLVTAVSSSARPRAASLTEQENVLIRRPTPPPAPVAPTLMLVYVKVFGPCVEPATLQLDLDLHSTLASLRSILATRLPYLVVQRLLYAGRLLNDDSRQLRSFDIYKESTIQTLVRSKTEEERQNELRQQTIVSPAKRKWNFLRRKVAEQFSPPPKPLRASATASSSSCTAAASSSFAFDALNHGEAIFIDLLGARDLPAMGWSGKVDPYALCCLQGATICSSTRKDTREPSWNEIFVMCRQLLPPIGSQRAGSSHKRDRLHILLFDHDYLGRDESLGFLEFDVDSLPHDASSHPTWHRLQGAASGEVNLRVRRTKLTSPQMLALVQSWAKIDKPISSQGTIAPEAARVGFSPRALQCILGELPFVLPIVHQASSMDEPTKIAWRIMEDAIGAVELVREKKQQMLQQTVQPASSPPSTPRIESISRLASRRNSATTSSMLSSPLLQFGSMGMPLPTHTATSSSASSSSSPQPLATWNPALFHLEQAILTSMNLPRQGLEIHTGAVISRLFASTAAVQEITAMLISQKVLLSLASRLTRFLWITNLPCTLSARQFHELVTTKLSLPVTLGGSICIKSYHYSPAAGMAYLVCTNIEQAVLAMLRLRTLLHACSTLPSNTRQQGSSSGPVFACGRKMRADDLSNLIHGAQFAGFIHATIPATFSSSVISSSPHASPISTAPSSPMLLHLSTDGVLSGHASLFPIDGEDDARAQPLSAVFTLDVSTKRRPDASPPAVVRSLSGSTPTASILLLRTSPSSFEFVCNNHSQVYQFQLNDLHHYSLGKTYIDGWMKHLKGWRNPIESIKLAGGDVIQADGPFDAGQPANLIQSIEPTFMICCALCARSCGPHELYRLDTEEDADLDTCRSCLRSQAVLLLQPASTACLSFSTLDLSDLLTEEEYVNYLHTSTEQLFRPLTDDATDAPSGASMTASPYTQCPSCHAAATVDVVEGASDSSLVTDEAQLVWWQQQVGVDGRKPSIDSYAHFVQYRVLCRNNYSTSSSSTHACATNFCRLCRVTPYHLGFDCADYAEYASSPKCRFCSDAVTKRNHLIAPPSTALEHVCGQNEECEMKSRMSCLKTHSGSVSSLGVGCGHVCRGIRNESFCLPCLDPSCVAAAPDATGGADVNSECAICFTDPLGSAPVIMLQCSHLLHYRCLLQRLAANWTGDVRNQLNAALHAAPEGKIVLASQAAAPGSSNPRIHFSCINCPLCSTRLVHPALHEFMRPYLEFEKLVRSKAIEIFKQEGLVKHEKVARFEREWNSKRNDSIVLASSSKEMQATFTLEVMNFYECFTCKKPYFAGARECGPAEDGEAEGANVILPSDLLCSSCKVQSSFDSCEVHGSDWVMYKCRFCCAISTYHCWDSTHFCDVCHHQDVWPNLCAYATGKNIKPLYEYVQCPGLQSKIAAVLKDKKLKTVEAKESAVRGLYSDPETCPLGVRHGPNGMEVGLGCAMCRDEKAEAENARKSAEQARAERERWMKLRTRMAHLIPNTHEHASKEEEALWLLPAEVIDQFVEPKIETQVVVKSVQPIAASVYDSSELHTMVETLRIDCSPYASPSASPHASPSASPDCSPLGSPRSRSCSFNGVDRSLTPTVKAKRLPTNRESYAAVHEYASEDDVLNIAMVESESPNPQLAHQAQKLAGILAKYQRSRSVPPSKQPDSATSDKENVPARINVAIAPSQPPSIDASKPSWQGRRARLLERARSVVDAAQQPQGLMAKPPTHSQPARKIPVPIIIHASAAASSGSSSFRFLAPFSQLPVTAVHALGLLTYLATDNQTHPYVNPCNPQLHELSVTAGTPTPFMCDLAFSSVEEGQSGCWNVLNGPNAPPRSIQTRDFPLSSVQIAFHHVALQLTHYAIYVPSFKPSRTLAMSQKEAAERARKIQIKRMDGAPSDPNMFLTSWRLEGSNTGHHWEVLDEQTGSNALQPLHESAENTPTAPTGSSLSIFSWSRAKSNSKKAFSEDERTTTPHRRVIFAVPNSALSVTASSSSSASSVPSTRRRYTMFRVVQTDVNSLGSHILPFHGFDFFGQLVPAMTDQNFLQHDELERAAAVRQALRQQGCTFTIPGDGIELTQGLEVPLSELGRIVQNLGSAKWRAIRVEAPMVPTVNHMVYRFSFLLLNDPATSNSWHFNIGVVNGEFDLRNRCWIGSQPNSFGYIAGTGGVCNESGISRDYGSTFGAGDLLTVVMNFTEGTVEFLKNNVSQGIAFHSLDATRAPYYPAVSLHAVRSQVKFMGIEATGK